METQEQEHIGITAKEIDRQSCSKLEQTNERIEGTPFTIRWEKDKGYSWGMPPYRISEFYKTKEELEKDYKKKNWENITGAINAMIDATLKIHNLIK